MTEGDLNIATGDLQLLDQELAKRLVGFPLDR
jgi:hypothetical protein